MDTNRKYARAREKMGKGQKGEKMFNTLVSFSRCGGAVFKAEQISSRGKSYHKKGASCASCAKQLDHNSVHDGEDGDVYCKNCYSRKFAPAGYRGAGTSDWVDAESSNVLRHSYMAL